MAEKKIGEIKEELKAVDDEKLPSFIETYEKDERSGVVKIVEQAKKRFEKLEAEKLRIENLKKYEREYADYGYICGIDEVGRGPLAGPVVAQLFCQKTAIFCISTILRSFLLQSGKNCMM